MIRVLPLTALALVAWSTAALAQTYKRFDKVEAEVQPGFPWESCHVMKVYPGAYDLRCDVSGSVMVRDTRVRKIGGQPIAETAANPVVEGQYKFNDIVLASPNYQPSSWELCAYVRPQGGGHAIMCGGETGYVVSDKWIRPDTDGEE